MIKTYTWQDSTTVDFDEVVDCMKERADRFYSTDNALYGLAMDAIALCVPDDCIPNYILEQIVEKAVQLYKEAR